MPHWYDRYQQGFHQRVYDELLAMQEQVFGPPDYEDALLVARAIMKRVRSNIDLLLPRLHTLGYQFGVGFWQQFDDLPAAEKASIEQALPIFQPPAVDTPERLRELEHLVGPLPLSLKAWYEEVGSVNLIGLFATVAGRAARPSDGPAWDPLFLYSLPMVIKMVKGHIANGAWERDPTLSLAPDCWFKYGFSGSGAYAIRLPCRAFDAPFLLERHQTTFVNYLRVCFQWGGFPGLEADPLSWRDTVEFLTKDLLRF